MQEIFELNHAPRPGLRDRRSVLVHDGDLGFCMARASAMREILLGMRTEAFRTVPEAMAWLFPGQGLTELPAEVAAIHQARLGTGPVLDSEKEVFEDSIHSVLRKR